MLRSVLFRLAGVALGVVIASALLELGLRTAGGWMRAASKSRNLEALSSDHSLRVLCLGESTTAGGAGGGHYPEMLEEILNHQQLGVGTAVVNLGTPGYSSDEVVEDLLLNLDTYRPQIVVTMMGINDVGRTHAWRSILEPGEGRWYGSFRLYKLYRSIRYGFGAASREERPELVLGEGIAQTLDRPQRDRHAWLAAHPKPVLSADAERARSRVNELIVRIENWDFDGLEAELLDIERRFPGLEDVYLALADLHHVQGDPGAAEDVVRRGCRACGRLTEDLAERLVRSLDGQGRGSEAIATCRFLIDNLVEPGEFRILTHHMLVLARLFETYGEPELAEETLLEVVNRVNPGNEKEYQYLVDFYERQGRLDQVRRHSEIMRRIRDEYVSPRTVANYERVVDELGERGIRLFAMQYPTRPVGPLELMLADAEDVVIVDQSFFRGLVAADDFETYFRDDFAGDFGHLTKLGNCLMAENLAKSLVEEVFGLEYDESLCRCGESGPEFPEGDRDPGP